MHVAVLAKQRNRLRKGLLGLVVAVQTDEHRGTLGLAHRQTVAAAVLVFEPNGFVDVFQCLFVPPQRMIDFGGHALQHGHAPGVVGQLCLLNPFEDILLRLLRLMSGHVDARQRVQARTDAVGIAALLVEFAALLGIAGSSVEVGQAQIGQRQDVETVSTSVGIEPDVEKRQGLLAIGHTAFILLLVVEPFGSPVPHLLLQRVGRGLGRKDNGLIDEFLLLQLTEKGIGTHHVALHVELLKQVVHTLCLGTKHCHRHQTEPQKSLHFTPFLILLGAKLRLSERKAKQKTKFFAFPFPNVSNFGEAKVTTNIFYPHFQGIDF